MLFLFFFSSAGVINKVPLLQLPVMLHQIIATLEGPSHLIVLKSFTIIEWWLSLNSCHNDIGAIEIVVMPDGVLPKYSACKFYNDTDY